MPEERAFLAAFLHEATTAPFTGPATDALHSIGVEYGDLSFLAWAYEREVPRTGFTVGRAVVVAPPLPWLNRAAALRRNREMRRRWKEKRNPAAVTPNSAVCEARRIGRQRATPYRSIRYKPKGAGFRIRDLPIVLPFVIILALLALGALGRYAKSQHRWIGDGSTQLTVSVKRNDNQPLRLVVVPISTGKEEEIAEIEDAPERALHACVVPFENGQPFKVLVAWSCLFTSFGQELRFSEPRYLVVWYERPGKSRQRMVVAMPADVRKQRHLTITLPDPDAPNPDELHHLAP
jgi:hypothetical protein